MRCTGNRAAVPAMATVGRGTANGSGSDVMVCSSVCERADACTRNNSGRKTSCTRIGKPPSRYTARRAHRGVAAAAARGLRPAGGPQGVRHIERLALERIVDLAQCLAERRIAELAQPRITVDRRCRQHRLREHDALAARAKLNFAQQAGRVVDLQPLAQRRRGPASAAAQPPESHRGAAQRAHARREQARLGQPGEQLVRHARRRRRRGGRPVRWIGQAHRRFRTGRRSAP